MVRGIGVDSVEIQRIYKMLTERPDAAFLRRGFTPAELAQAPPLEKPMARAEYLSARFAVKEAVFKAVAHLTKAKNFDLRIVETLYGDFTLPVITTTGEIAPILAEAGVDVLHVSITTEAGVATAFVVAESAEPGSISSQN